MIDCWKLKMLLWELQIYLMCVLKSSTSSQLQPGMLFCFVLFCIYLVILNEWAYSLDLYLRKRKKNTVCSLWLKNEELNNDLVWPCSIVCGKARIWNCILSQLLGPTPQLERVSAVQNLFPHWVLWMSPNKPSSLLVLTWTTEISSLAADLINYVAFLITRHSLKIAYTLLECPYW